MRMDDEDFGVFFSNTINTVELEQSGLGGSIRERLSLRHTRTICSFNDNMSRPAKQSAIGLFDVILKILLH